MKFHFEYWFNFLFLSSCFLLQLNFRQFYSPFNLLSRLLPMATFSFVMSLWDAKNKTTSPFSFLMGTMSSKHQNGLPEIEKEKTKYRSDYTCIVLEAAWVSVRKWFSIKAVQILSHDPNLWNLCSTKILCLTAHAEA